MKLGPIDLKALGATPATAERKPAPGKAAAPAATPESAKVDLSAHAALRASGEGSFDQAKVDRVAQAIRDGTFQVNAGAIADKLIANAQELLGRVSR